MTLQEINIVEYTKKEERINCFSHLIGLVLSGLILYSCLIPSVRAGDTLRIICAALYLFGTSAMFIASVLYHAAAPGNRKKDWRASASTPGR